MIPTRSEFQSLQDIVYLARETDSLDKLQGLVVKLGKLVPHQFSGCGMFSLLGDVSMAVGHSSYPAEFCQLYTTQAILTDPAIHYLVLTPKSVTSSEDPARLMVPTSVTTLKLDFGIRTCLSAGVRGMHGTCSYYAFSNFDGREQPKLRMLTDILAPHLHLAYMRCIANKKELPPSSEQLELSQREGEIMKWVAEGKTNWEISVILKVSLNTVKFHLKNIFAKVGVENRWSAVARWQWSLVRSLTSECQVPGPRDSDSRAPAVSAPTDPRSTASRSIPPGQFQ